VDIEPTTLEKKDVLPAVMASPQGLKDTTGVEKT
jgi:hypothetical protein